jgi:hypothetical protein
MYISVTLDGAGHWVSDDGGTIVVSRFDSQGSNGSVDAVLSSEAAHATLRGSWRCAFAVS